MVLQDTPAEIGNIVPSVRRRSASVAEVPPLPAAPRAPRRSRDTPAHFTPSSIQYEVSHLNRPITMGDIAALLDRASQPLPHPTPPRPPPPRLGTMDREDGVSARERTAAESRLEVRISDLQETARELRYGAVQPLNNLRTERSRQQFERRAGQEHVNNPAQIARSVGSSAIDRFREWQQRRSTSPQVNSRVQSPVQFAETVRAARREFEPTNLGTSSRAPVIVRSSPASPASTITPDRLLDSAFPITGGAESLGPLGFESPAAVAHVPLTGTSTLELDYYPSTQPVLSENEALPPTILIETTETIESADPGYAVYVPVTTPQPEEVILNLPSEWGNLNFFDLSPSPSTSTAPRPRPRNQPHDSLTSRGMRVEARINNDASAAPRLQLDSDERSFLSSFPTLRELFDEPQPTQDRGPNMDNSLNLSWSSGVLPSDPSRGGAGGRSARQADAETTFDRSLFEIVHVGAAPNNRIYDG